MKAHSTTTTGIALALALVLAISSFAVPASADARTDFSSVNAVTSGPEQSSTPVRESDYSSINAIEGGSEQSSTPVRKSDYSSINAIEGAASTEFTPVSSGPTGTGDGFDWLSAGVGAGAVLALVALSGAAFMTLGRRPSPSRSVS